MTITKKNLPGRHANFTADFRTEAVRLESWSLLFEQYSRLDKWGICRV